jgi:uncharacterized protein YbaP (TraB family)
MENSTAGRRNRSTRRPLLTVLLRCALRVGLLLTVHAPLFAANDRGLFYRAERAGIEIYLLGSVHVSNGDLYPLRAAIETPFAAAQILAVELDITKVDPTQVATWMAKNGTYPEGDSLRQHLQPETWQRLSRYLQDQGIEPQTIERQKPGLLVSLLSMRQLSSGGLLAQLGIDQHFLDAASNANKPLLELETVQEQLELLADLPNPDRAITEMLDEIDSMKAMTDDLTTLWKNGDAAKFETAVLEDMAGDDPDAQAFIKKILQDRNHTMTERLLARHGTATKIFVVVGAAHLVGAEGIPALLQQRGFTVEQR